MKVRAAKGVRVPDPVTGRPISDSDFVEVEPSRYWRRRAADGSIEVEEEPEPAPASKKSAKAKGAKE